MMEENHQLMLGKLISGQTKSRISMEKYHSKVLKKMAKEGKNVEQRQNQLKRELQELLTIQDLKVGTHFSQVDRNKIFKQAHRFSQVDRYIAFFQHREMKSSHNDSIMKLCKDHYQLVLELQTKHHEHIYDALNKLMETNHAGHTKALDEIHDREVNDLKKKMDAQSRDHMKVLGKKHKDKQELSRYIHFFILGIKN